MTNHINSPKIAIYIGNTDVITFRGTLVFNDMRIQEMRSGLTHLRKKPEVRSTHFDLGAELFGDMLDDTEVFEPVTTSELDDACWSVVSFSRQEADGLTFRQADELLTILESYKVRGLCIVTDEAAKRIKR